MFHYVLNRQFQRFVNIQSHDNAFYSVDIYINTTQVDAQMNKIIVFSCLFMAIERFKKECSNQWRNLGRKKYINALTQSVFIQARSLSTVIHRNFTATFFCLYYILEVASSSRRW
jgi:uncharacterized protein YlbG (UPF0298 family)